MKKENAALSERQTAAIADHVYRESSSYRIDYRLILAVMKVESNFNEDAVSRKGAMGLLQIKPSVGRSVAKIIGMELDGQGAPGAGKEHKDRGAPPFEPYQGLYAYTGGARRLQQGRKEDKSPTPRQARPPQAGRQARYTGAVMGEYTKTLCLLPDP